jgi:hypothetical protein
VKPDLRQCSGLSQRGKLYDRHEDELTLDEVVTIAIRQTEGWAAGNGVPGSAVTNHETE